MLSIFISSVLLIIGTFLSIIGVDRNLKLGLDKTKELVWAQNDLFEANQSLQKAMKTIKEVLDKP